MAIARFEIDGRPRIAWATRHDTRWASQLAVLDASGTVPADERHTCTQCPQGQPITYFVLERSELARMANAPLYIEDSPPLIPLRGRSSTHLGTELPASMSPASVVIVTVYGRNPRPGNLQELPRCERG
jgi:hypothetical protein